eukprot:jgi/Botrbrau1/16507/Bobra.0142s0101.1
MRFTVFLKTLDVKAKFADAMAAPANSAAVDHEFDQVDNQSISSLRGHAEEEHSVVGARDEESLAGENKHGTGLESPLDATVDQEVSSITCVLPGYDEMDAQLKARGLSGDQGLIAKPAPDETLVTPDGGVLKTTLRHGKGDLPPLHAQCLVHYVGRLSATNEVFMDTKSESETAEPVCIVAGRDSTLRELGLHLAVCTMRKGEICRVRIQPPYGYGEKGSFSFPSVPPRAELIYEVELVGFETPNEEKPRAQMTYEERLEVAERRRLEGNVLFKAGNYVDALGKYAMGVSYLGEDFMMQLDGPHLTKAEAVSAPLRLNMAAAQIQMGDYEPAIFNCNQAMGIPKLKAKALFRRGKARAGAGHTREALEDMEAAAKEEPGNRAVAREIKSLKAQLREERTATDQLFRGRFKPPVPPPRLSLLQRCIAGVLALLRTILDVLGLGGGHRQPATAT